MNPAPDIKLHYEWHEGSLPPPHHYEYRLDVRDGDGRIEFSPDYPAESHPLWVEPFVVDPEFVEKIVDRLGRDELLRSEWEPELEPSVVGGSVEWLELTLDGSRYTIPSHVLRENEKAREIAAEIRSLVPEPLWDELMRRRRGYEDSWTPSAVR